MIWTL